MNQQQLPDVKITRSRFTRSYVWFCRSCGASGIVRPVRHEHEVETDHGQRTRRALRQARRVAHEHVCGLEVQHLPVRMAETLRLQEDTLL